MKILLVVRREDDAVWLVESADEYTLDAHNGTPDFIQKALDEDPANTRILYVKVPDDAFASAFHTPTVNGEVVP